MLRPVTPGLVEVDIARVLKANISHPTAIQYDVILHTATEDLEITQLISIEVSRDYASNITDFILVSFALPVGMYVKQVHSNQDNLEMTIITRQHERIYPERYKMVINKGLTNIAGTIYTSYTEEELNKMDMVTVEAQCLSRLVEAVRLMPVSGIYHYTTVSDVIKTVLTEAISEVAIEGAGVSHNISISPANNDKKYRHIMIPTGVRVLDLPTYLQNTDYGVYSTDIGTYVQKTGFFADGEEPKETVFVYPLYNNELTDHPGKMLMILSSPTVMLSKVENSYLEDGDILKIIGSGDMKISEIAQTRLISNGSSLITTNTDQIIVSGSEATDDLVTTKRDSNLSGVTLKGLRDGNTGARYVGPTANIYKQYSEMAKDMLCHYQVTWNLSNPELLFPGMPVVYVYEDEANGIIRLKGILHSTFTKYNAAHKTHITIINILVEPYVDGIARVVDVADITY